LQFVGRITTPVRVLSKLLSAVPAPIARRGDVQTLFTHLRSRPSSLSTPCDLSRNKSRIDLAAVHNKPRKRP
jgi:hypothetical protein